MTLDEKLRLAKTAAMKPEWQNARLAMVLALNTTMRACEIKSLRWHDVDFLAETVTIRRSKTQAGQRVVPQWQRLKGDAGALWAGFCD
jgi:integrase